MIDVTATVERLERHSRQTEGTTFIQKENRWEAEEYRVTLYLKFTTFCKSLVVDLTPRKGEYDSETVGTEIGYDGPECHRLVKQLKDLHQKNLRKIDHELGSDGTEVEIGVT